jgi:hypothetical protein
MDQEAKINNFLRSILGDIGLTALAKACQNKPEIVSTLLPRAILAFLKVTPTYTYTGELPGQNNTVLQLSKNEAGFSGVLTAPNSSWAFKDSPITHVAAAISVSLGVSEIQTDPDLTDSQLLKLGKSLDLLAKAQALITSKAPKIQYRLSHTQNESPKGCFHTRVNVHNEDGEHVGFQNYIHKSNELVPGSGDLSPDLRELADQYAKKKSKLDLKKAADSPGPANTGQKPLDPNKPMAPLAATTGQAQKPANPVANPMAQIKTPKANLSMPKIGGGLPKLPKLKLSEAQIKTKCPLCGYRNFGNDGKFEGCICFQDLAKSVKTSKEGDLTVAEFSGDWDSEALAALLEIYKK